MAHPQIDRRGIQPACTGAPPSDTEFPDITCPGVTASPFFTFPSEARASASGLRVGQTISIRGVGFYDVDHGQQDASGSCLSLHPVISVEPVR